jgi:hypothetical protein
VRVRVGMGLHVPASAPESYRVGQQPGDIEHVWIFIEPARKGILCTSRTLMHARTPALTHTNLPPRSQAHTLLHLACRPLLGTTHPLVQAERVERAAVHPGVAGAVGCGGGCAAQRRRARTHAVGQQPDLAGSGPLPHMCAAGGECACVYGGGTCVAMGAGLIIFRVEHCMLITHELLYDTLIVCMGAGLAARIKR